MSDENVALLEQMTDLTEAVKSMDRPGSQLSVTVIVQGLIVAFILSLSGVAFHAYNNINELKVKVASIEKIQSKDSDKNDLLIRLEVTVQNIEKEVRSIKKDLDGVKK